MSLIQTVRRQPDADAVHVVDIALHHASGEMAELDFYEIAPSARSSAPRPRFVLGHASEALHAALYGQFEVGEVGCYSLRDGLVAPTGIAFNDGCALASEAFNHPPAHVAAVMERWTEWTPPVRHVEGTLAVIYGPAHECVDHWFADFLPRLWVLAEAGHDLAALRFLVPPELSERARALLEHVGIGADRLVHYEYWTETIRADLVLMPTGLRRGSRMSGLFAEATRFWAGRLAAGTLPSRPGGSSRIMLSDEGGEGGGLLNRASIAAIAVEHGFTIVRTREVGPLRLAGMLRNARCIVGEQGAGLPGAVHARAGAAICALIGEDGQANVMQSGVAAALGHEIGYVVGKGGAGSAGYAVDEADFERALEIVERRAAASADRQAARRDAPLLHMERGGGQPQLKVSARSGRRERSLAALAVA